MKTLCFHMLPNFLPSMVVVMLATISISNGQHGEAPDGGNVEIVVEAKISNQDGSLYSSRERKVIFTLEGRFLNSTTHEPVEGVLVTVTNSRNSLATSIKTDANGKFLCDLHDETIYLVEGHKQNYFEIPATEVSTIGATSTQAVIEMELPIQQIEFQTPYRIEGDLFELNGSTFTEEAPSILAQWVKTLSLNPSMVVEIACHTDSRGDDSYNLSLSQKRSELLASYLVSQGISKKRLIAKGLGEQNLINTCGNGTFCESSEHLQNRRIEFTLFRSTDN